MILKFLENPFDTDKLSREDLNELAKNHVAYLVNANTAGIYSEIIALVAPKAGAYNSWFNTVGTPARQAAAKSCCSMPSWKK